MQGSGGGGLPLSTSAPVALSSLAPWQEIEYFDNPSESVYVASALGQKFAILQADPHRVAFIVSSDTAFFITTATNPAAKQGLTPGTSGGLIEITQAIHGPLCQVAWTLQTTANPQTVTVMVSRLLEFPGQ